MNAPAQQQRSQNGQTHQQEPKRTWNDWAQEKIAGSFADVNEAAKRLQLAAKHCHLVGGASMCPLVEGHEIVITIVPINPDDVFPANPAAKRASEGKPAEKGDDPRWGVGKSTLMTLAAAAGVEWQYSKRQDDGRDPRYCHWKAQGRYRQIDGCWRPIDGERDVDVRDGSDQIINKSEREVAGLRQNVMRSAITKAKLRAIREAFGLTHGLRTEELDKPFVFSRMVFTGRSTDPQIRRLFAGVIAQQQLAATAALYGPAAVPQLGGGAAAVGLLGAGAAGVVPIGTQPIPDIDEPPDMDEVAEPSPAPARPPASPPPATQQAAAPRSSGSVPRGGFVIPGGKEKGVAIMKASDDSLQYWGDRIAKALDEGTTRYVDKDRALLEAIRAEQQLRARGGEVDEEPANDAGGEIDRGDDPEQY